MAIRDSEIFPVNTSGTVTVQSFFMSASRSAYWLPMKSNRNGISFHANKGIIGVIGF